MVYLVVGCAALVGTVFVVSSFSKLHSRGALAAFLRSTAAMLAAFPLTRGTSRTLSRSIGFAVIVAEVGTATLVVIPATAPVGFAAAGFLLLGFNLFIAATLRRGTAVSCRCFGASPQPLGGSNLLRNSLLLVAAAAGLVAGVAARQGPATPAGLAVVAGAAVVVAVLLIRFDDLVELLRPSVIETKGQ